MLLEPSARLVAALQSRLCVAARNRERGDVPGWVMVTVMTAGLVAVIFTVFKTAIVSAIKNALDSVISQTGG